MKTVGSAGNIRDKFLRVLGDSRTAEDKVDRRFKERNVMVGVVRNKYQFYRLLYKKFYHIPMCQIMDCEIPIRYVAIYQSKKLFGNASGIKYYGELASCNTVPRNKITEIPKNSDEPYLYCRIKKWHRLTNAIKAKEMDKVAFSTTLYLLKNAKDSTELQLRSEQEYELYTKLVRTVKKLVNTGTPDHNDIVYGEYRVRLQGGLLYLYFADAVQCILGYDVFLENPMDIVKTIFDYYPEL